MSIKRAVTMIYRRWQDSRLLRALLRWNAGVAEKVLPMRAFWYGQYPHTFLERVPPADLGGPSESPRVIWAFWTGPNEMSTERRAGLDLLIAVNDPIPVVLVTPANLQHYLVDGRPLHPAYEHLSYTHRADYLRAYFMHHHGGGYSDVKPMKASWGPYFSRLDTSRAWLLGPALPSTHETGNNRGRLGVHLRRYHRRLVAGTAMVVRSHTLLTAEWLREVERTLTYAAPALEEHPHEQSNPGYPLAWMDLLGDILQPLLLKYSERVLTDAELWWDTEATYR